MTSEPKSIAGHCPKCGPDRWALIVGVSRTSNEFDDIFYWSVTVHRILRCQGCDTNYFQEESQDSENTTSEFLDGRLQEVPVSTFKYWPAPVARKSPKWLDSRRINDPSLQHLLESVYVALSHHLDVLAAIGIRTAFDRASELVGVDPALSFKDKIDELIKSGKLSANEKEIMEALTDAGSAAAHRAWRPDPEQLELLMELIEAFIHRNLVLIADAAALKASVPPKPKRKP